MMKKIIAAILLGIMLCSLAAVSFADANSPKFSFDIITAGKKYYGQTTGVMKNDSEQICYVTTEDGELRASDNMYIRCRDHKGDHEATQSMHIKSTSYKYKLKYTVQKGIAKEYYRLRGEADSKCSVSGRWNP